jgi:hypothetical protein
MFLFTTCEELTEKPTPTRELMQGVWEVTEAYDTSGESIMNHVSFLMPTYIKFDDYNSVSGTLGPMFMYIVYGESRFINITGKLDAAFDYLNYDWTTGEYGIKDGEQNRFVVEIKMKLPGTQTLTEILDLMGVSHTQFIEPVIYHKFMNTYIYITDDNPNELIIEFDDAVEPEYNVKDPATLDYVLWTGVSVNAYSRCMFKLKKKTQSLEDLVNN